VTDVDIIAKLRRELESARLDAERADIMLRRAMKEHAETREHMSLIIVDNSRMQTALRWYLEDDRRAVEEGILETVAMRPAFEALGGQASGVCSAHREPSKTCLTCYPSPPRPRVSAPRTLSARS